MSSESDYVSARRLAMIGDAKILLRGLESGATDNELRGIIRRIRENEQQLLHEEGVVLDPELWRIIHSRMTHRNIEFVDPEV